MENLDRNKELREVGYTFLKGFFSENEIVQLSGMLERAKPRQGQASRLNAQGLTFNSRLFMHSQELQSFLSQQKIIDLLTGMFKGNFWLRWDQLVTKVPGGQEFPWHQDNGYNNLVDEYYQLWIAITDITRENGNLWLIPGSHRHGLLPHTWVKNHSVWSGDDSKAVPITAKRGDAILFSSLMLHRTSPNSSDKPRIVYVSEFMSNEHLDPTIEPPYFRVSTKGHSDPGFMKFYKGNLRLANHLKYLPMTSKKSVNRLKGFAKSILKKGK